MNAFCCNICFISKFEPASQPNPSRREGTKIAQGKRSAALGRLVNLDAPPRRGGTNWRSRIQLLFMQLLWQD